MTKELGILSDRQPGLPRSVDPHLHQSYTHLYDPVIKAAECNSPLLKLLGEIKCIWNKVPPVHY